MAQNRIVSCVDTAPVRSAMPNLFAHLKNLRAKFITQAFSDWLSSARQIKCTNKSTHSYLLFSKKQKKATPLLKTMSPLTQILYRKAESLVKSDFLYCGFDTHYYPYYFIKSCAYHLTYRMAGHAQFFILLKIY